MSNTSNQSHVLENSSTEKSETANMSLTPPPFSYAVENTSLWYNYIADESSPSPDPYGIGMENSNNNMLPLPINVSSDIPLLTLPKKHFNNNNNIVHQPFSSSVVENTSLRYNYIADESSPSPDPYGIGMENSNNMLPFPINVSSDIPLLTLPKKRFKNNNIVHQPFSSSGYGFSMVTNLSAPHSGEGTSSAAVVAAATMELAATSLVPSPAAVNVGDVVTVLLSQPSENTITTTTTTVEIVDNVTTTPTVVPSSPNNTSNNGDVAITIAPPPQPMPENEEEIELEAPPLPFPYPDAEQGANRIPFEVSTILVKRNKNIVRKLVKFAQKQGLFILGATGTVSLAELLNDEDAPVAKTTLQGTFEVILLDGNIVIPKNYREVSWLTILMAGKDSRIKGGPVKRLVAASNVEIVVAPLSEFAAESMARQQYLRRPELAHFPNYRNRDWLTKEVVSHIHKATLKELNNETTNRPA